jgi:hypothetical protein
MSLGAPGRDAIEPCGDHHMTLMSALSTVVLDISSGAVFGILAARFGELSAGCSLSTAIPERRTRR